MLSGFKKENSEKRNPEKEKVLSQRKLEKEGNTDNDSLNLDFLPAFDNDLLILSEEGSVSIPINKEVGELSKKGYQFIRENQLEDAAFCFKKILEIDKNNTYAIVGLGDIARKQDDFHAAQRYYRTVLTSQPENNYALFGLADCYKAFRQYSKAIDIWEQYLYKDKNNITVLTRVADAYRKVKDFRSSKHYYQEVLNIDANNPYALIGMGHLHYDFREYDAALFFWEKMLTSGSTDVDIRVLTSIGNCYRKLKLFGRGLVFFEKALELEPDNFYALFGMANCYRGTQNHTQSLVYWEKILEREPTNKVILTRVGDAYRNLGDFENAEKSYQRALAIDYDTYAILGLALLNKIQGQYDEAVVALNRLIAADPKNHRFYVEKIECYQLQGKREEALQICSDYEKLGLSNPSIHQLKQRLKATLAE